MRLSDAIALGRVLGMSYDPSLFLSCDGERGCAIGMALKATGKRFAELSQTWPWLDETAGRFHDYRSEIGMRFTKVCKGQSTLDELINYVRSVEPPESTLPSAEDLDAVAQEQSIAEKTS